MLRLNSRGLVVAVVAIGLYVAIAGPAVSGYQTLCAAPVDTYPTLEAALNQARAQAEAPSPAAAPDTAAPAPGFSLVPFIASARASALDLFINVKQSDPVAFAGHVVAGAALQVGGCASEATADQWRKAAGHAWADLPARLAAFGLEHTAGSGSGLTATLNALTRYATDEPWHGENLRRVEAQFRDAAGR